MFALLQSLEPPFSNRQIVPTTMGRTIVRSSSWIRHMRHRWACTCASTTPRPSTPCSCKRMGHLPETPAQQIFVRSRTRLASKLHRSGNELMSPRRTDVFRHPLTVTQVCHRQPGANQHRDGPAETRCFVELGEYTRCRPSRCKSLHCLFYCTCLRGGGQHERRLESLVGGRKHLQLLMQARVTLAVACCVDEHEPFVGEMIEQFCELARTVDGIGRHAQQAAQRVDLLVRADPDRVGGNQRNAARPMLQQPARSELGDERCLANAGCSD